MLVHLFESVANYQTFDIAATNLRNIMNGLQLQLGEEKLKELLEQKYKFIAICKERPNESCALSEEVLLSDLSGFSHLCIIRDVAGETGIEELAYAIGAVVYEAGASLIVTEIVSYTLAALIYIGAAIALSTIMQMLTPTNDLGKDPSSSQGNQRRSSLFNGPVIVRDQGGPIPLIFGEPYCGGTLISSSIFVGND